MSEFVYLFRGGNMPSSPEQSQQLMGKWAAWMRELNEKGYTEGRAGRPLEPTGQVVTGKDTVVTDGPYAETKDMVGGYMLIKAADLAQASEIARGCPHLDVGGLVEVRPVTEMTMPSD